MKVLHVIPSISPLRGGPSHAVVGMVRALGDAGCDAEVACTDDDGPGRLDVSLGRPLEWNGIRVNFFERLSPGMRAFREFQYGHRFGRWLRRNLPAYDLLHVHAIFSHLPSSAMHLARRIGKPYIVRPIGQLAPWSLRQKAVKKRLYLALGERRNIARASGIHCTSEAERRDVMALGPDLPAFVSPIGVERAAEIAEARAMLRALFSVAGDERVVLYLGRLHPKKGIEELIAATARLPAGKVVLIIAGSGEHRYEARVRELATASRLQGRVRFAGFVAGADKDILLQGSDIFALLSQHENFGISVLEALMAGLPVLIASGVALEDFVRKIGAGVIIEPTADAAEAALRCMVAGGAATDEERRRISDAAAAAFSWGSIARELIERYDQILGRRPI